MIKCVQWAWPREGEGEEDTAFIMVTYEMVQLVRMQYKVCVVGVA